MSNTQYLLEHADGTRERVSVWQFEEQRRTPAFRQILATPSCVVYRMGRTRPPPPALKYGGRGNGMKADHRWNGA